VLLWSWIGWLGLVASGCAHPLDAARSAYVSGDYARAYVLASQKSEGAVEHRQEAYYIAGMAANLLQEEGDAQRHLTAASRPANNEIAGRAAAQLGLIYHRQGRLERAVPHLAAAAPLLHGEDRANAYLQTAVIEQKLGRWSTASANLEQARRLARRRETQQRIAHHARYRAFTVQLGAFTIEANARRAAALAARRSGKLSPAVVIATGDDGGRLYLVQIGQFRDVASAALIRRRFGGDAIVVPK